MASAHFAENNFADATPAVSVQRSDAAEITAAALIYGERAGVAADKTAGLFVGGDYNRLVCVRENLLLPAGIFYIVEEFREASVTVRIVESDFNSGRMKYCALPCYVCRLAVVGKPLVI